MVGMLSTRTRYIVLEGRQTLYLKFDSLYYTQLYLGSSLYRLDFHHGNITYIGITYFIKMQILYNASNE